MNPEAAAWLESLTEDEHIDRFRPCISEPGKLFGLKDDHESCGFCPQALCWGNLLVIG
jgi:hypothetical protein